VLTEREGVAITVLSGGICLGQAALAIFTST
jgi:hypothetical protein